MRQAATKVREALWSVARWVLIGPMLAVGWILSLFFHDDEKMRRDDRP